MSDTVRLVPLIILVTQAHADALHDLSRQLAVDIANDDGLMAMCRNNGWTADMLALGAFVSSVIGGPS